jgi:hypothetical protein
MTHVLFRVLMNLIRSVLQHAVYDRRQRWPHPTHRRAPRTRCPSSASAAPRARAAERRERAVGHVRVLRAQHAEHRGGKRPEVSTRGRMRRWAQAVLVQEHERTQGRANELVQERCGDASRSCSVSHGSAGTTAFASLCTSRTAAAGTADKVSRSASIFLGSVPSGAS